MCACVAPAAAQTGTPRFALDVERVEGKGGSKVYHITSSGTVAAAPNVVWRLLTDYEQLADYLPNLHSARVVSREGERVVIEQIGTVRFLFFSRTIRLLVEARERAPDRIDIGLVEGDMKVYRARWELSPLAGASGTRITYSATIVPKFDVPGIVGTGVVRRDIASMMAAVFLRLDRQEAQASVCASTAAACVPSRAAAQ